VYVLISSVILVNLLVAMFSDTYSRVLEQAEEEFRYQRYQRMYTAQNVWAPSPPPFSLPSNLLKLLQACCRPLRRCLSDRSSKFRSRHAPVGAADGEKYKRRAPAEAKRLQQRYLEKSHRDQSKTVDAKTSALQGTVHEIVAKQEQQFILLTEQMKGLALELQTLKSGMERDCARPAPAIAPGLPPATPGRTTWEATKPPAEPIQMPEADSATVPPIAVRSGSGSFSETGKRTSFLSSTLRSLSPRRSPMHRS
jgi:hypothetical protein